MMVHYRLIQFREDPLRAEGRNVAVIVWTRDRAHLRALGVDPFGRIDPAGFERLLPQALRSSAWVYAEWVERWTDIARRCEGDAERLLAEFERIEEVSGAHWVATEGGEVDVEPPTPPTRLIWTDAVDPSLSAVRNAADALYKRLIAGGVAGGLSMAFLDAVDTVLSISETRFREGFTRDETIAVGSAEEAETFLFFPYLVDGSERTGIKLVCFGGPSWEATVAAVNDSVLTFDLAVAAGFLPRNRCVALVDRTTSDQQGLAARLARSATLIDVTVPDAPSQLWQIVLGER